MHPVQSKSLEVHELAGPVSGDPRLARSAHAFEASLMTELLKPMQQSAGPAGEDGGEGSADALAGFAVESLARVISDRGGFGIADRVLHSLASHTKPNDAAPVGRGALSRPPA